MVEAWPKRVAMRPRGRAGQNRIGEKNTAIKNLGLNVDTHTQIERVTLTCIIDTN